MSSWLINLCMERVLKEIKVELGEWEKDFQRRGENRDCLASGIHMTWHYAVNRKTV